ncbi:E3 ubiquitin-protein ligase XIAP-like [Wyeomyia smithii]|uniref:E3 ubiquitin-protein ligase XIAP-like n=1 Tax=Wyeomyia smithii TaxID=174621 RepID=UPI002467D6BC|nr:E3 ubiquitin-protein ligase XIAP-like [Wyeomyia smithii]
MLTFDCTTFDDNGEAGRFQFNGSFPEMAKLLTRLETFKDVYWKTNRKHLANAGFFFTGRKTTVQCFYCGLRLAEWEPTDDAWKAHAEAASAEGCYYLTHMKGKRFVEGGDTNEELYSCFKPDDFVGIWTPCKQITKCVLCNWEFALVPKDINEEIVEETEARVTETPEKTAN